jgi:hypothetical protein
MNEWRFNQNSSLQVKDFVFIGHVTDRNNFLKKEKRSFPVAPPTGMPPLRCVGHLQVRRAAGNRHPMAEANVKMSCTTACVKTAFPLTHAWPLTSDKSATAFSSS